MLSVIGDEPKTEFHVEDIDLLENIGFNVVDYKKAQGGYQDILITISLENNIFNIKMKSNDDLYEYNKKKTLYEALNHIRTKIKILKKQKSYESNEDYPQISIEKLPILNYGYNTNDRLRNSNNINPKFTKDDISRLKFIGFKIIDNDMAVGKFQLKLFGKKKERRTDKIVEDSIIKIYKTDNSYNLFDDDYNGKYPYLIDALFNIKYRYREFYKLNKIMNLTKSYNDFNLT